LFIYSKNDKHLKALKTWTRTLQVNKWSHTTGYRTVRGKLRDTHVTHGLIQRYNWVLRSQHWHRNETAHNIGTEKKQHSSETKTNTTIF